MAGKAQGPGGGVTQAGELSMKRGADRGALEPYLTQILFYLCVLWVRAKVLIETSQAPDTPPSIQLLLAFQLSPCCSLLSLVFLPPGSLPPCS